MLEAAGSQKYQNFVAYREGLDMEEQEVLERYNAYKTDPNAWLWLKEVAKNREFGLWGQVVADHFQEHLRIRLKNSNERIVEIFPAQFLWGQETGYRSGIGNERMYQVKYGTYATGYFCLTSESLYIVAFAKLTKKFPLMEPLSFVGAVLLGVLGERDERTPYQKDGSWLIPLNTILDANIFASRDDDDCIVLTTTSTIWNFYLGDDLQFPLTAINMARFGQLENKETESQATSTGDHRGKLQELKDLFDANLITQSEYEAKKQEILSRL